MSTPALTLFGLTALALVGAILLVVRAIRSVWRRYRRLAGDLAGLQQDPCAETALLRGSKPAHVSISGHPSAYHESEVTQWEEDYMFGLRRQERLIILLIVVILFGAKKLPQVARGMG